MTLYRNPKALKLAEGEECLYKSDKCNGDWSTTVFCHLDGLEWGKGLRIKGHDIGFFGCYHCHQVYEGKMKSSISKKDRNFLAYYATIKTIIKLIELGVMK